VTVDPLASYTLPPASDHPVSSPSERIREARERLSLDPSDVAAAAGLNDDWYVDVEQSDNEVRGNISLDQLAIGGVHRNLLADPRRRHSRSVDRPTGSGAGISAAAQP